MGQVQYMVGPDHRGGRGLERYAADRTVLVLGTFVSAS